ncbi:RTXE polymerase, partial [Semnornis frantzii]|nr:RTXE polymerase [Semnornis frantzii]
LRLDLKNRRRVYGLWKRGYVSPEDYKDVVKLNREKIRRAKAQLELNLATAVKDNKKCFYKFINAKRRTREKLHPLLNAEGNLVTKDEEKAEMLNAYFASVFSNGSSSALGTHPHEVGVREGNRNEDITTNEAVVTDLLCHLDVHKSVGSDELHPGVLRELVELLAKPLSIIYQKSWLTGEVPMGWRVENVRPIYKKGRKECPGNYRPVSLTSVPGKVMEQGISNVIICHIDNNQGIRPSQHGFMRGRSCLTNLISFYYEITRLLDEGKAVDIIFLGFQKAFDTVPHKILADKLATHGSDEHTVLC